MQVVHLFEDFEAYQRDEAFRRGWLAVHRPVVDRILTHFERKNWDLFAQEAQKLNLGLPIENLAQKFDAVCVMIRRPLAWFIFDHSKFVPLIEQRLALSKSISYALTVDALFRDLLESGRLGEWWRQARSARNSFFDAYLYLHPMLQPLYWRDKVDVIENFVVCNKGFQPLKDLYISAFESLARLSVLAIGLEAIISHGKLEIPSARKKGNLSLHDFESLTTGNKRDHLEKYPIAELFVPFLDTELRNGIGHHAARFDPQSDEVVVVKAKGAALKYTRLPYTEFCRKVLSIVSRLAVVERYLDEAIRALGGEIQAER